MSIKFKSCFFSVLLCGLLIGAGGLWAGSLHLVLVGDTLALDISESVRVDVNNIHAHAQVIASNTGLALVKHQFTEQGAKAQEVLDYIKQLEAQQDDVVIFYFSGHGYRTPSKEANPWPNLYFVLDQSGVDLLDIARVIKEKSAHFTLVIADCCNNSISDRIAPRLSRSRTVPKLDAGLIQANMRKLFLETSGQVIASGSKADQFAYGNSIEGGRFSFSYLLAFNTYTRQAPTEILDWQRIFDEAIYKTKDLASKYGHDQEPVYVIQK